MGRPLLTKIIVAALVASAALFAVGAALEHHAERNEAAPSSSAAGPAAEGSRTETPGEHAGEGAEGSSGEQGEAPGGAEGSGHRETTAERRSETNSEQIFGVNPDALPLVVAAVAVSLLLAAGLWLRGELTVLLAPILLVGLGAAVFDVREAVHQADHSREGIMAIAILVALLHLVAAGCAGAILSRRRISPGPDPTTT